MSEQKFRPYFTAPELSYLIDSCKLRVPINQSLLRYLETFALKIDRGITSAAYTRSTSPVSSIEAKLGIGASAAPSIQKLVNIWINTPEARTQMSAAQLAEIAQYRYTNDLMSKEEERDYESNL